MAVIENVETPEQSPLSHLWTRKAATRAELIELAKEVDALAGITGEATMTVEELRQSQLAHGIRPEDNGASRELMRMRYGDHWEEED